MRQEACTRPRRATAEPIGPDLDELELCSDADGAPRGGCEGCGSCEAYKCRRRSYVRWVGFPGSSDEEEEARADGFGVGDRVEVRDRISDDWLPGTVASVNPLKVILDSWRGQTSGAALELQRRGASWEMVRPVVMGCVERLVLCERCGCTMSQHAKLEDWISEAKQSLRRFRATGKNTKREQPRRSRVPANAISWRPDEVALFVLTEGLFDPRRDGHGSDRGPRYRDDLVSVVTPTSEKRHHFHALLYESFRTQTYEPKELVVVDTGSAPSAFLVDRASRDPRVVYRWFNVNDARTQDLGECFMDRRPAWQRPGQGSWRRPAPRRRADGQVHGGVRVEGWTLGLKRNLACHLARGSMIAHFDDDDLYAPRYLEVMSAKLREAAGRDARYGGELPPAAVTLQDWHVLDLADQTFGFVNPREEALLPEDMRESFTYGFGFSYVYSRAAWELATFADVEWAEDGNFTDDLMSLGKAVQLVRSRTAKGTDALAAHSHHRDTTSAGEFIDYLVPDKSGWRQTTTSVRLGSKVAAPKAFQGLLPLVRQIAGSLELRKGEAHPIRKQLSERTFCGEIGLEEKQAFMRTEVGRSIERFARHGPEAPQPSGGAGSRWPGERADSGRAAHWGRSDW